MPLTPKCPRCNLAFGTKDPKCPQGPRMPLMLNCGHTFCSDCLARLAKQQRTAIVCHTCQHTTELSEECSVKTLWPDVYVHGLLAVNRSGLANQPQVMEFQKPSSNFFNKTPPKPNLCEECSAKTATCRCLKCDVILCGVCFEKIHRVSNVLRQHHAEPYNAKDSDVNYGKGISPMCVQHKRSNEFFCTDEDIAFCAACAGLGCHKDHLVITIEDKERSDLENVTTVLGQANNILQHSKKSSQLINSLVPACQSHGSRLIERLQEHFLQLHGTLQAREHSLIETLLKSFQKDIGPVVEMEATLVEQIRKIETIIGDARAVISGTKRNLKGCQVLEQLTDILDVPCYATVAGGGNLQVQFKSEDEKLLSEMQQHGELDGRFVDSLKFDRLSDVSVMNERGEHVPLSPSSGRISAIQTMLLLPFDMKNGGSDLDSISLNSDHERPTHHDLENESAKFKPRDNLKDIPLPKSRFKVHSELVHVSHIYNPCSFYVNLSRDLSTLTTLSRNIHTHCSYTGKQDIPTELDVGDQVLAQFGQDGQWYRAQVIEVNEVTPVSPATIRVLYTDYGNKELTSMDRIRNIHPKFMQHPKMAKQCTLVDIVPANGDRWSNETINTFARITKDRPMIMSVLKEVGDLWYVDLSRPASEEIEDDGPVSVRDALVFLDMASFISPHSMPSKIGGVKQRCYLRPGLPQLGESVRVTLTFVSSPHDFFVQMLGSESRHLQELMMNMQKTYEEDRGDLYTMFCPAKGMLCAAKYAHDGLWYRAEVVELRGGCQVSIRYVDYGNIELMSVWKLKKLLDVYLVLPAQAVHCRLADVGPAEETGQWQAEATAFLRKLLNEPELTVKVKEVINRWTLSVYLHSEMMLHSVNTSMISNGWAMATGPGWEPAPKTPRSLFLMSRQQKSQETSESAKPSVTPVSQPSSTPRPNAGSTAVVNGEQEEPSCPKVVLSHVVSPGEFYVQDFEKIRLLQQLMTKVNDEDKKSCDVSEWKIADVCAVQAVDDKRWYRGQIANIEDSTAEVFLVDFGYKYSVELSSLLVLPDSLKSVTRFTIRCHFAEIVPAGDPVRWSQTSCDALKSLVLNKKCFLVVKSNMDESSSLPVDLLLEVFLKGGAVTPDKTLYNSVAEALRDKGLALKKRISCPTPVSSSSLQILASITNHVASDAVPVSNQSPATVATSEQPKEELPSPVQSPTVEASDGDYPPPDIPPSDRLVLGVTHVDKSGVIYGQEIKADLRYLQQLMDRVANHYKNSPPSIGQKWRQGELVVAQYTEDDGFYRAKILTLSGNFAEVYYVDYGNKETLSTERLRPAIFTDEPAQCFQCRLHGLAWNSGEVLPSDDACSSLYQLLVGKVCTLHIKEKSKPGSPLTVDITTSEGKDLSQFLIDARFAVRQEPKSLSPVEQDHDPSATSSTSDPPIHHQSPAKAPSQSSSTPKLTPGHAGTERPDNKPSPIGSLKSGGNGPSQGSSPVVRNTLVEPSSTESLTSSVVDSSNKAIPPAFPHPCGYGSFVDDADASRSGAVSCRIPKRKVPSPYPQPPEPKVGDMMIMTVTQVDAPDLVYLQCIKLENVTEEGIVEMNNQLDKLLELNKYYGFSHVTCPVLTASQLTPGRPCIAQFSVDECWYRAEIVDVRLTHEQSLEVDVLFVDYGSSDCLKRLECLRSIPEDDLSLPAQSMLCHLDGILPRKDWSAEDLRRVEDVVRQKVLITSVKNVENGEIFVDLFEQEVYTREGVIAPLVYQPLVDEGILTVVSPAHASTTTTSLTNEDSSESTNSESDSLKVPSASNIEEAELFNDPAVSDI